MILALNQMPTIGTIVNRHPRLGSDNTAGFSCLCCYVGGHQSTAVDLACRIIDTAYCLLLL